MVNVYTYNNYVKISKRKYSCITYTLIIIISSKKPNYKNALQIIIIGTFQINIPIRYFTSGVSNSLNSTLVC